MSAASPRPYRYPRLGPPDAGEAVVTAGTACPTCHRRDVDTRLIERSGGRWCPRCRAWAVEYVEDGTGRRVFTTLGINP